MIKNTELDINNKALIKASLEEILLNKESLFKKKAINLFTEIVYSFINKKINSVPNEYREKFINFSVFNSMTSLLNVYFKDLFYETLNMKEKINLFNDEYLEKNKIDKDLINFVFAYIIKFIFFNITVNIENTFGFLKDLFNYIEKIKTERNRNELNALKRILGDILLLFSLNKNKEDFRNKIYKIFSVSFGLKIIKENSIYDDVINFFKLGKKQYKLLGYNGINKFLDSASIFSDFYRNFIFETKYIDYLRLFMRDEEDIINNSYRKYAEDINIKHKIVINRDNDTFTLPNNHNFDDKAIQSIKSEINKIKNYKKYKEIIATFLSVIFTMGLEKFSKDYSIDFFNRNFSKKLVRNDLKKTNDLLKSFIRNGFSFFIRNFISTNLKEYFDRQLVINRRYNLLPEISEKLFEHLYDSLKDVVGLKALNFK